LLISFNRSPRFDTIQWCIASVFIGAIRGEIFAVPAPFAAQPFPRCALAAEITHLDLRAMLAAGDQFRPLVGIAIDPSTPDPRDISAQLRVVGPGAQAAQHVPAERREQTGVELAV